MCILQQLFQLGTQGHRFLHTYWAILGVTFLGSIVSCFTECQPFQLYWQVVPDPGKTTPVKNQREHANGEGGMPVSLRGTKLLQHASQRHRDVVVFVSANAPIISSSFYRVPSDHMLTCPFN
jgi:hypothetical protein